MDAWIIVTLGAVLAQTARFALQKRLTGIGLSTVGATFARFVYSAPLVIIALAAHAAATGQALPAAPSAFWAYAVAGGTAQILATMCVVALFSQRNFAVGITFKKTEVLMSVLVGLILLGEGVSLPGLGAILAGFAGVVLLSDRPGDARHWTRRILNRSAALGLASGVMFAISGVGYRGASLALGSGDTLLRALVTLACVTLLQTLAMGLWLWARDRAEIVRVAAAWRVAALVGITGMIGSACWFSAFTLQVVAYVNALGQVELILSMAVSAVIFGERLTLREAQGLILVTASVLILVLVA